MHPDAYRSNLRNRSVLKQWVTGIAMKRVDKYLVGVALSLAVSATHAALVTPWIELRAEYPAVEPGELIPFDLLVDFGTQLVLGGTTEITFNPGVLSFAEYVPASFPNGDIAVYPPAWPFTQTDTSVTIGFGSNGAPITGAFKAGTLSFNVNQSASIGTTKLTLADGSGFWTPFLDPAGIPIVVNYIPGEVLISAVPLPPTAWLFASGLAMLGFVRLQRRVASA
jgi:hypothetical protein